MSTASCSGPPVISVGSPGFYLLHQETWDSLITYLQMTFTASGLSFLPDQTEGIDPSDGWFTVLLEAMLTV